MRRRTVLALAGALVVATTSARAGLDVRPSTLAWDKAGVLRGTFSYRDAIDDKVKKRFASGLPVTIVMRGYVYPNAGGEPVALTAHTCKVVREVWDNYLWIVVNGGKRVPVINVNGVYRLCTDMLELPITERKALKGKPTDYYLAVKVEVNPVDEKQLKEIQRWVTRPLGVSGTIGAGDALFATFVSVFMKKQVAAADRVVEFRTASFPP